MDDGKLLNLNDKAFIGQGVDQFSQAYTAPQMPTAVPDDLTSFFTRSEKISFFPDGASEPVTITPQSLSFWASKRQNPATDDTDAQLIDINFQISEVSSGGQAGVDGLSLRLIQDEQGKINLLDIVRVPADGSTPDADKSKDAKPDSQHEEEQTFEILPISPVPPPSAPNGEPVPAIKQHPAHIVNCHGMPLKICKLQWLLRQKFGAIHRAFSTAIGSRPMRPHHRPCPKMGMRPHGPPGLNIKGGVPKFTTPDGVPIVEVGKHRGPHGHHHQGHSMVRKTFRCMRRFFFGFVVPVLIGVAAGMTASLAGMVVGTGIAMLWFKLRRGSKKGQQSAGAVEEGEQSEREGLISKEDEALAEGRDSEETLPAYEEKPSQTE